MLRRKLKYTKVISIYNNLNFRIRLFFQDLKNSKKIATYALYGLAAFAWIVVFFCFFELSKKSSSVENLYQQELVLEDNSNNLEILQKENTINLIQDASSNYTNIPAEDIYNLVWVQSEDFNLDPYFVLALVEKECNFKETARAADYEKTGSLGWSQASKNAWSMFITKYICKEYNLSYEEAISKYPHTEETLFDPEISLTFICWYLNWLQDNFSDKINTKKDLYAAYNGGPHGIQKKAAQRNSDVFMSIYDKYSGSLNLK